uniref:Uncharacterized protein n=1 Tax=Vannella robusta TaxID=1487602 RepID=A0A7S4HSM0_9EUKA|mmetsp:Transcript_15209/g.19283  ORF Transcript_15209/g.19283 Transcript_15209/m.19283 type:complete len:105 (+) Transcript_15209:3-317(+)
MDKRKLERKHITLNLSLPMLSLKKAILQINQFTSSTLLSKEKEQVKTQEPESNTPETVVAFLDNYYASHPHSRQEIENKKVEALQNRKNHVKRTRDINWTMYNF